MLWTPGALHRPNDITLTPFGPASLGGRVQSNAAPSSGSLTSNANFAVLWPIDLVEPFTVAKFFWANGATVGTDSFDLGVYAMTDQSTGRCDLIASTGLVLSAGTVSQCQETATIRVAANAAALTTGVDSTDATTYTTASVTLKAGRLYLLSFVNTAASAAAIGSIAGGGTWTSQSTTQYNSAGHRVSIWSCVPTADYTGTIVVTFGATQTGGRWAINEFSGVDTSTNDGVVQNAVGTGNSTTPLATLAAFAVAANATFGALANTADNTTTPGAGFTELSDLTTATVPASFLQTQWRADNDTTVDGTITSGQWGACAVEIKATTSPLIIPAAPRGAPYIYGAFKATGTTALVLRSAAGNGTAGLAAAAGLLQTSSGGSAPLPTSITAAACSASRQVPLAGFSSRTLLG